MEVFCTVGDPLRIVKDVLYFGGIKITLFRKWLSSSSSSIRRKWKIELFGIVVLLLVALLLLENNDYFIKSINLVPAANIPR